MDAILTKIWETWDRALEKAERWGVGLLLLIGVITPFIVGIFLLPHSAAKTAVWILLLTLLLSRMFYVTRKEIRAIRGK